MPNTDIPRGLRYHSNLPGTSAMPLMKCNIAAADGTAVFLGDLVKFASTGATGKQIDCPNVIQAAAADAVCGVVEACDQFDEVAIGSQNLYRLHRPASTAMYVYVRIDPNALYEIQEDADGGALAAADVNLNADFIVAAGNATTGLSGMELDSSTKATTATLPLKIMGFINKPDNEIGANAKVLVKINNHQLGSHTGTAGV